MALRGNRRRTGEGAVPAARKPLGAVRRAQLVTTYGVGSLVAMGEKSYMVSGIDTWAVEGKPDLHEFRLQTHLGVTGFRLPPYADPSSGDGVRVRLFPQFYSCPGRGPGHLDGCEHNLKKYRDFNSPRGKNQCASCEGALTPSRFVVACENGHVDDFPYWRWVHAGGQPTEASGTHHLAVRSDGRTASLRSIVISCSCGKSATMEGAFGRKSMESINHVCTGLRPWLGRNGQQAGCSLYPRVMQRGSSAAWFSVVRSALSIPPFSEQLHSDLYDHYQFLRGEDDEMTMRLASKITDLGAYDPAEVLAAVRDYESYEAGERDDPSEMNGFEAAVDLRLEEYKQLSHPASTPHFECEPAGSQEPELSGLAPTMLVPRLREVRALQSFTRVKPPAGSDPKVRFAKLSLEDTNWLPAMEVIGEGVFVRLDTSRLADWESCGGQAAARAETLRRYHSALLARRASPEAGAQPESTLSARYLVVHTMAHMMINEWSLESGYPAAALRERLYVSGDMAGVLIYTATSDSAGSLGGLVAQGLPARLHRTFRSGLDRVSWCSADPLCMESDATGADSLNLAACHACVLVPETSCEVNNTFLDRAMLVGTPGDPSFGYFA